MKTTLVSLAACAMIATPALAEDGPLSVLGLESSGGFTFGYDNSLAAPSIAGDVSIWMPISVGAVDLVVGARIFGFQIAGVGPTRAMPFAGVQTDWGDIYFGGVQHSTTAFLPAPRIAAAGAFDAIVFPYPFKPYHSFIELISPPSVFNRVRYDGQFGDFGVSGSYDLTTRTAAGIASYSFGYGTVYAGVEAVGGFAAASYIAGIEASYQQFDFEAVVNTSLGTTTPIFGSANLTYNVTDAWAVTGSVSGGTGGVGIFTYGAIVDYKINDAVSASVGYTNLSGTNVVSAGFNVDLN